MKNRFAFSSIMLWVGLAFIYIPMVILVIYSFNASRLVTVWGGWSVHWYVGLLDNTQLMQSNAACRSPFTPPVRQWHWARWQPS